MKIPKTSLETNKISLADNPSINIKQNDNMTKSESTVSTTTCKACNGNGKSSLNYMCVPCMGKGARSIQANPTPRTIGFNNIPSKAMYSAAEKSGSVERVDKIVPSRDAKKNEIQIKTAWGSVAFPVSSITSFSSSLPKLPFMLFASISGYLQWCALEHNAEGRVDLTLINGEWVAVCFFQEATGTLDVTVDKDSAQNKALLTPELEEAFKRVHSTIHSHTTSPAFQSGTDEEDEMDKEGWHITLGTYGSGKVDNHARYTVRNKATRDAKGERTAPALNFFFKVTMDNLIEPLEDEKHIEGLKNASSDKPVVNYNLVNEFPKEWESRFYKAKQPAWGGMNRTRMSAEDWDEWDEDDYRMYNGFNGVNSRQTHKEVVKPKEVVENNLSTVEEEFERVTKIDFDDLEKTCKETLITEEIDPAEYIGKWFSERATQEVFHWLPHKNEIHTLFFNYDDEYDIACDIAEIIIQNSEL